MKNDLPKFAPIANGSNPFLFNAEQQARLDKEDEDRKEKWMASVRAEMKYALNRENDEKKRKTVLKKMKEVWKSFDHEKYSSCSVEERLDVLKRMSQIVLKEIEDSVLVKRRNSFNRIKNSLFPTLGQYCWCCRTRPAVERHHVVLLKYGGPVSSAKNVVLLCQWCHAAIHPWMPVPGELKRLRSKPDVVETALKASEKMLMSVFKGHYVGNEANAFEAWSDILAIVFNELKR